MLLVFAPGIALATTMSHTLLAIWGAKAGLNGWRCMTAVFRIHVQLWPTWASDVAPEAPACDGDHEQPQQPAEPSIN